MRVRLPGDLKPRLVQAAQRNGRTINAEIVHRLESTFARSASQMVPEELAKAILDAVNQQLFEATFKEDVHQATAKTPPPAAPGPFFKKSKSGSGE
jgi:hypothetical protein